MTQDTLNTLSTGDVVRNTKTGEIRTVIAQRLYPPMIDVEEVKTDLEAWELHKSRFVVTKEELALMAEYHRKIKEQEEKQRK